MSNKQFVQLLLNKKRIINHWRISSILDGNENDYDGDEHVSFPAFLKKRPIYFLARLLAMLLAQQSWIYTKRN